jgi:hypothetical protein
VNHYTWANLIVDVGRMLDERGVQRRHWHDGEQTQRIRVAAEALLAALGVEEVQR